MSEMETTTDDFSFDHGVTSPNTVKHWTLYTLDAIEEDADPDPNDPQRVNTAREHGTTPQSVFEFAGGEDSIVFANPYEVKYALEQMAEMGSGKGLRSRPVARKTRATEFDDVDGDWVYRLTEYGRRTLRDLGRPTHLPNRQSVDHDRQLDVKPSHDVLWWEETDEPEQSSDVEREPHEAEPAADPTDVADPETEPSEAEAETSPSSTDIEVDDDWDAEDNEWIATPYDNLYYFSEEDVWGRGEERLCGEIAEAFPEATFVITMGPNRLYDMAYAIRDPFRKVVQIDVYSPMLLHRTSSEIGTTVGDLARDLHHGLQEAEGPEQEETDDD